jgi:hypothetical protein
MRGHVGEHNEVQARPCEDRPVRNPEPRRSFGKALQKFTSDRYPVEAPIRVHTPQDPHPPLRRPHLSLVPLKLLRIRDWAGGVPEAPVEESLLDVLTFAVHLDYVRLDWKG